MNIESNILKSAKKIWNYLVLDHKLQQCDVMLVFGSNDVRTAKYAAHLYNKGLADVILFSGKDGSLTKGKWDQAEAEVFRDVALSLGVPENKIILETNSTNTGQNVLFSHRKLTSLNIRPRKMILVHTPYMERRTYATFLKQYPDVQQVEVTMTSPRLTLEEYPCDDVGSLDDIISVTMGCLQRLQVYPDRGFHVHVDIPNDVMEAYGSLKALGCYNSNLLRSRRLWAKNSRSSKRYAIN